MSMVSKMTIEERQKWSTNQAYIALGNLMTVCAIEQIDACPMEGFQNEEYNKILDLNSKNLNAAVVVTLGYRSEEDATQHHKKVRKSEQQLFINFYINLLLMGLNTGNKLNVSFQTSLAFII